MIAVVTVIHVMIAFALIGSVLIQKSEGGGLGVGGGGMSGFMTGRSQANLLTRTTSILAIGIMVTSVTLAVLSSRSHHALTSVLDKPTATEQPQSPENKSESPAPAAPAPSEPPAPPVAK
jgi:preprotein translocase subunit SecG